MATDLDLILPSCAAIPRSMWIATSAMLDEMIPKCWKLLGAFVTIKMLWDAFSDIDNGRISLHVHIKTLFQTLCIAVFLAYYKSFLMVFDYFIDCLCIQTSGQSIAMDKLKAMEEGIYRPSRGIFGGLLILVRLAKLLLSCILPAICVLSHGGAIMLMHYVRVVSMIILMQFGPIAVVFSLLPGPFKQSFHTWIRGYINVSCWAITLNILWVFVNAFGTASWLIVGGRTVSITESVAVESVAHALLSIVLFIAIFCTPSWTSKFVSSANLPNLLAGIGLLAGKLLLGTKVSPGAQKMIAKSTKAGKSANARAKRR